MVKILTLAHYKLPLGVTTRGAGKRCGWSALQGWWKQVLAPNYGIMAEKFRAEELGTRVNWDLSILWPCLQSAWASIPGKTKYNITILTLIIESKIILSLISEGIRPDLRNQWFFLKFYFIFKLYNIVLVLPNIEMNPPQVYMCFKYSWFRLPWWLSSKEFTCNAGDVGSIPALGRSPWRRAWQPTLVFLPRESHGQRSLVGYSL